MIELELAVSNRGASIGADMTLHNDTCRISELFWGENDASQRQPEPESRPNWPDIHETGIRP